MKAKAIITITLGLMLLLVFGSISPIAAVAADKATGEFWAESRSSLVYIKFNAHEETGTRSAKGQLYFDLLAGNLKYYTTSWQTIAASTSSTLDEAYDAGYGITVDGNPVTLTVGAAVDNAALQLTSTETTNNNDVLIIDYTGSGNAIYVDQGAADSQGMTLEPYASSTVASLEIDGDDGGWKGADNVGMLHLRNDVNLVDTGATLFLVDNTGQPDASCEGFLARFVDNSTATTTSYAVEIETTATTPCLMLNGQMTIAGQGATDGVLLDITSADTDDDTVQLTGVGTADVLQITPNSATAVALNIVGKASSSVTVVHIDGDTGDWIGGADDVAMVEIIGGATANANAGGSLLAVISGAKPAASTEGLLARFIHTGSVTASTWAVEIETANTQGALNVNNNVTLAGASGSGTLLTITHNGTSGDADAMTIASAGSGDSLQISPTDTDSGGINVVGKAAGTVPLVILDSSTNNMNLADNKGQLLIQSDFAYNVAGATGLMVYHQTGQPKTGAEGFLARFVSTGTAQTNASAVEIEVPATQPALAVNGITKINGQDAAGATLFQVAGIGADGDADAMLISNTGAGHCLQITPGETDSGGINMTAKAAGTVPLIIVDSATNNWNGVDEKGMVHITQDAAFNHAGATSLCVISTTAVKSDAEGFLARFISDATAQTGSYGVQIQTTNTMPALHLNNQLKIDGSDSTGILVLIDGDDTTGDTDTIVITHGGDGNAIQMTLEEPAGVGINIIGDAAGTHPQINIDLETGAWVGAATTGAIEVTNDGLLVADASLLRLENKGKIAVANDGACLEVIDSGAATGTSYAVRIAATHNEALHVDTGTVLIDETLTCTVGNQNTPFDATADDSEETINLIPAGTRIVEVTAITNGANDFVTLSVGVLGERCTIIATVACELRTLATSDDEINEVDSDGTNEYQLTAGDIVDLICVEAGARWAAVSHTKLGAAKTVVPDA